MAHPSEGAEWGNRKSTKVPGREADGCSSGILQDTCTGIAIHTALPYDAPTINTPSHDANLTNY
jgi:hypothetical protein